MQRHLRLKTAIRQTHSSNPACGASRCLKAVQARRRLYHVSMSTADGKSEASEAQSSHPPHPHRVDTDAQDSLPASRSAMESLDSFPATPEAINGASNSLAGAMDGLQDYTAGGINGAQHHIPGGINGVSHPIPGVINEVQDHMSGAISGVQDPNVGSGGVHVKTTGLRRAPLSGGVKTATARFDLPAPQVAVRNLVEQAQFGHLCTVMSNMHHRRSGYPFGTLVDFAADGDGYPIFCLSPLAIHARNLVEDSRCSLVVQMPGWTGLANARVTIFGDVYKLPNDMQSVARDIFLQKHNTERKERWVTGNFTYFRMHRIVDIYFVGGFGTVQWIDPQHYHHCTPDAIAMHEPRKTLQALSDTYAQDLRQLYYPGHKADDAAFISIDASGADIRVRHGSEFSVERIGFASKVYSLEEASAAVKESLPQTWQTPVLH